MSDELTCDLFWNPQALLAAIAARGSRPALIQVTGGDCVTVSSADLAGSATRLAHGLVGAGVAPHEPVVLIGPNSPAWVTVRLAIAAAGAMAVPLDDQLMGEDVQARIRQTGCRYVFATAAHLAELTASSVAPAASLFALDDGDVPGAACWHALLSAESCALPAIAPDWPAVIVFTSGTTGTPKRFTLSYANIGANVAALDAERLAGPEDRFLLPLPLDNIYPYVIGLLTPLSIGAPCVFPRR